MPRTNTDSPQAAPLQLAIPKGRMFDGVVTLLADAGLQLRSGGRDYRPVASLGGFEIKILKPQNIVEMLHAGSRDLGFAGADWVAELDGELVELLDTRLDPVRLVAAAPRELLVDGRLPDRPLVIASEYERLTRTWLECAGIDATLVRSYGATEVFPPEDADFIIDNTATGSTLRANGLVILDDVMASSTRLYANPRVLDDPERRGQIETFITLLDSVLNARRRALLEVNVSADRLAAIIDVLPCMREPTVSTLSRDSGFAVKVAVLRADLPLLIPRIKACGGTDIVVSPVSQIVP